MSDNEPSTPVGSRPNLAARLVDSRGFTSFIVAVITVNAVVLGLHTYPSIDDRHGDLLVTINAICLGIFIAELVLRFVACWPRPGSFFRNGWNVFDLIVIGAVFVPGVRENATLLRVTRVLRIVRVVRLLPDVRVLLIGVWRSVPPLMSVGAITAAILFIYGMLGWTLFADAIPQHWGNIGRAMLTLFVMLTLENFPVYMDEGMAVYPWSWVYFVSFILVAAFIVLNVLIGIVLNSMEEAREGERRRAVRERAGVTGATSSVDADASAPVLERIATLRVALEELETELAVGDDVPHPVASRPTDRAKQAP